jgi:predicted unusual protein kinase regulating ubiquinone biosynthesis (AarF/ABC1/UbiB family)
MLVDVPVQPKSTTPSKQKNPYITNLPTEYINEYNNLITSTQRNKINGLTSFPPLLVSSTDPKTICLVDAGMVAQLSDFEAAVFIGVLSAIGEGDGIMAAKFALQFSTDNDSRISEQGRIAFTNDMVDLFAERCRGYGTNVDLGHVLRGVLSLLGKHRVRVDSNFATLVVNVLCIQGLAYDVCPEYNALDAARPLLQTYRYLCFTKDGVPNGRNPRTSKLVRLRLWSMYIQKRISDDRFFHKLATERQQSIHQRLSRQ